ncbi:MAG: WYL domain-containing protein [Clostridiales bacterium]|nr:WYL domain-containing protein [Clostridiales bacterium]
MIFSELYSAYYNTVARIIETAFTPGVTEKELQQHVLENAFSESVLTILPSLKSGKWPLLKKDLSPVLKHIPTMPLTLLEKQWLKAICEDPRMKLFGVAFPYLADVEPLFTRDHYRIFDQYVDGDPFEDETYIRNFRLVLNAIREKKPIQVTLTNRFGKEAWTRLVPVGMEYSMKDDKIRVIADKCKFRTFNLGRITSCEYYTRNGPWRLPPPRDERVELTMIITDERNALERALLHFAHFEKQCERLEDNRYLLRLKYYEQDDIEMVIRILSFGPCVQVIGPESMVEHVKKRLKKQIGCELR